MTPVLLWLHDPRALDPNLTGQKAARLATLARQGLPVPPGFVLTTHAYALGMTETLADTVRPAYHRLIAQSAIHNPQPVAVRSSAVAEDLTEASFAGLQTSVLNVESADAVIAAVSQVWDSTHTPQARAYRERMGVAAGAMAVLVQHQVAARVSGVAFGCDPVTGEAALLVEAGPGLGELVVAGRVEPQSWRVVDGQAAEAPTESLLTTAQLDEIGALVEAVAETLDAPPDVEWAFDQSRLWLLQARPITTGRNAAARDDWFTDRLPGDRHLWTAAFLNERFTQPVSPLGWTLVAQPFERRALREPLSLLGASLEGAPLLKLWRGHPYTRVAIWQRIYKLFPSSLLPEDAARYFPDGDVTLRRAPRRPVFGLPLLWNGLRALFQDLAAISPLHNPRAWARFERRLEAALQRLQQQADELAADPQPVAPARFLLSETAQLTDELLTLHRWSLLYADLTYSLLRRLFIVRFGQMEAAVRVARLARGVESITTRLNRELAALASHVAQDAGLRVALARASSVDALPAGEFADRVGDFLARFGHRFFSLDICDPPWVADFPGFAQLLLVLAQGGEDFRSLSRSKFRGVRHAYVPDRVAPGGAGSSNLDLLSIADFGSLPPLWARPLFALTRPYLRLREAQRFRWQQILALQRQVALCLGGWWAGSGQLRSQEDVFGLTWAELLSGRPDPARAAARTDQLKRLRETAALAPGWHYPDFLEGNKPLPAVAGGAQLAGRPVSPGVVCGPARLVADPGDFARLCPGDILVTACPDPAWTPIFGTVAGMVTERGGQLSHGAVVAREYGLPAVSGMSGLLRTLNDGELLLVDGTQGLVVRLEVASETIEESYVPPLAD